MSIKILNSDSFSSWVDIRADEVKCDSLVAFGAVGTPLINTDNTPLLLATNDKIAVEIDQSDPPNTLIKGDLQIVGNLISSGDTFINPTFVLPVNNSIGPTTNFITNPGNYTQINSIQSTMLGDSGNIVRLLTSPTFSNVTMSNMTVNNNSSINDITILGDLLSTGTSDFNGPILRNPSIIAPIENSINPNTNLLIEPGKYTKISNIQSTFLGDSGDLVRQYSSPYFVNLTAVNVNGMDNLASRDTPQTFTNKTINSASNLIQINGENINTYLPTRYFASSQGIPPLILSGRKEYYARAITNASGEATFYVNSTGNIGGSPLFSSLTTSFISCVGILNTSSAIGVPLTSIKSITSDTITVNVVKGRTALIGSSTLVFAGSGITVCLTVIGN